MISQEALDDVRRVEEASAEAYRSREKRQAQVEEVTSFLLIAGLTETQSEPLAEKIVSIFVPPVPDYY
jgi:hypothetical protein